MRKLLVLVAAVAACAEPTASRAGPGCELSRHIEDIGTIRAQYADCTAFNADSLQADGWTITWDRK